MYLLFDYITIVVLIMHESPPHAVWADIAWHTDQSDCIMPFSHVIIIILLLSLLVLSVPLPDNKGSINKILNVSTVSYIQSNQLM